MVGQIIHKLIKNMPIDYILHLFNWENIVLVCPNSSNFTLKCCITTYINGMYHINYLLLLSKYYMNQTESQTFLTPIN